METIVKGTSRCNFNVVGETLYKTAKDDHEKSLLHQSYKLQSISFPYFKTAKPYKLQQNDDGSLTFSMEYIEGKDLSHGVTNEDLLKIKNYLFIPRGEVRNDLKEIILTKLETIQDTDLKRELLRDLKDVDKVLYPTGITHGDFGLKNLIKSSVDGEIYLIDMRDSFTQTPLCDLANMVFSSPDEFFISELLSCLPEEYRLAYSLAKKMTVLQWYKETNYKETVELHHRFYYGYEPCCN